MCIKNFLVFDFRHIFLFFSLAFRWLLYLVGKNDEKMVKVSSGFIAAESVCSVWAQVEFRGDKFMSILSGGTPSDVLLGEETQPDG